MCVKKKLLYILLFLLIPLFSFASNQTVYYEPEIVQVEGIVEMRILPGPPNYESIADGDAIESGLYLKLDHPIDVTLIPHTTSLTNDSESEKNIKVMQMTNLKKPDWYNLKIGAKHVQVTGTLFRQDNGHQHTRVLIYVNHWQEI